jgi:uncharacterized membrane protein
VKRLAYIDWARGLAVLLMIEAHTLDAWTRAADRESIAYRDATILAGFAAPLFLWLAGLSAVLSATRAERRSGSRAAAIDTVCRRGVEIFILAFLFRLQAFVISPGSHPITLFRVDILNIMGPAIALCAIVWGAVRSRRAQIVAFAAVAAAIAMLTPPLRDAAFVDRLPTWFQWYIRPAGEHTTFTAFPWIGFVFAGGACGVMVAAAAEWGSVRVHWVLALSGAALVAIGGYASTRPPLYAHVSFWTSSPTFFAIRAGILMLALAALYMCERARRGARAPASTVDPLARLGQHSLFVYWIHVELVYGYASWLWRRRLPLPATAIGWLAFSALMYGAVVLLDRLRNRRRILGAGTWRPASFDAGPQGVT